MHVERLPRRLRYRWTEGGAETEYPTDLPTPPPEIKCDEVMVTVPPSLPNTFQIFAMPYPSGAVRSVAAIFSWSVPTINVYNYPDFLRQEVGLIGTNQFGQMINGSRESLIIVRNSYYLTPSGTQLPRRDLLVGSDRIINPALNTPCPKWRFTGGNCPPGSIDCGNCCLDCASTKAEIEGVTAAVLPFSIWRPKP